jgi:prepilin-type N-terminal cleavage/methylation domain-containing protein
MTSFFKRGGFSLIEVVVAAGIFAVAVTVMLALLPALTRQSAESADALVAQGLPDRLRVELQRLASNDFNGLAHTVPVMGAPLEHGLLFVASRDGGRLHSANYLPPATSRLLPPEQRFFAIEAWRFNQGELRFDGTAPVLAVHVRVSWPYRLPGSTAVTPLADRSQFTFTLALSQ